MIYSKPIWFWVLGGFWAVLIFLAALGMVLAAIFTPPPFDQQIQNRILVFLPGAALIAVFAYGLPRSVKTIEIERG
ncbi:MAG: hypothetical protein AB1295_01930 [Candidatus Micrarchaeota archaeon]